MLGDFGTSGSPLSITIHVRAGLMASPFTNRRKPKRVGRSLDDGAEEAEGKSAHTVTDFDVLTTADDAGPVVRKAGPKNALKSKSKLRISFAADQAEGEQDNAESKGLEKKSHSGSGKTLLPRSGISIAGRELEDRRAQQSSRPTYSKDYLNELKNSTPSTPHDVSASEEDSAAMMALDVSSKFDSMSQTLPQTSIPTEAEIQEKKDRRSRLAKEQDFISLEGGSEGGELLHFSKKPTKESRLVREDEDIAEGFDDFVEDAGRVALGRKARAAQAQQERDAVRDMIAAAENDTEDESDVEQNMAYESAQTRSGMDGLAVKADEVNLQPSVITPIPRLGSVLEQLRSRISGLELTKAQLSKKMADLQQEKVEVAARESNIQQLVRETGDRYEMLRLDSAEGVKAEPSIA